MMRGFEALCSVALQSYETLSAMNGGIDQEQLVSITVDQSMAALAHPVAVIDLVLDQPEILDWKVPDTAAMRDCYGAEYIKAAVRSRVERRVRAALDS